MISNTVILCSFQPTYSLISKPAWTSFKSDLQLFQNKYPFVSPCGYELNFVRPEDVPIVFTSLTQDNLPGKSGNLSEMNVKLLMFITDSRSRSTIWCFANGISLTFDLPCCKLV